MRVGFPGGPRLEWYDRNAQFLLTSWNTLDAGPHATTMRWSYTVPTGKKAFIESYEIFEQIVTAAGTPGTRIIQLRITPSGGSITVWVFLVLKSNNPGDTQSVFAGHSGILLAGDVLQSDTYDDSTGGTVAYIASSKITEFDA